MTTTHTTTRRMRGDSGASLVEYALLVAVVAVVVAGSLTVLADGSNDSFEAAAI